MQALRHAKEGVPIRGFWASKGGEFRIFDDSITAQLSYEDRRSGFGLASHRSEEGLVSRRAGVPTVNCTCKATG